MAVIIPLHASHSSSLNQQLRINSKKMLRSLIFLLLLPMWLCYADSNAEEFFSHILCTFFNSLTTTTLEALKCLLSERKGHSNFLLAAHFGFLF